MCGAAGACEDLFDIAKRRQRVDAEGHGDDGGGDLGDPCAPGPGVGGAQFRCDDAFEGFVPRAQPFLQRRSACGGVDQGAPDLQILRRAGIAGIEERGQKAFKPPLLRQARHQLGHLRQAVAAEALRQSLHQVVAVADVVAQQGAGQAGFVGNLLQRGTLHAVARHAAGEGGQDLFLALGGHTGSGQGCAP